MSRRMTAPNGFLECRPPSAINIRSLDIPGIGRRTLPGFPLPPKMAFSRLSPLAKALALALLLSLSHLPSIAATAVQCEELPQDLCAFAVSRESKRCVLESAPGMDGTTEYQCRTSEVRVEKLGDWIETDACVSACGVDRSAVGISSDALLDADFTGKLCAPACYQNCPNIVDLYFNLAAAEGMFLPELCVTRQSSTRRAMEGVDFSGVASGPYSAAVSSGNWNSPAPEPTAPPPGY